MSSFTHETLSPHLHSPERGLLGRPSFSSQKTSDRLREAERRPSMSTTNMKPQRRSVFKEEGLDDLHHSVHHTDQKSMPTIEIEDAKEKNATIDSNLKDLEQKENVEITKKPDSPAWYSKIGKGSRPTIKSAATAPPGSFSTIPRLALIAILIAVVVPGFRYSGGKAKVNISGADAGVIMTAELVDNAGAIEGRQNSPTSVCMRWSHQGMLRIRHCLYLDS
jgi:hypothetical protein